MSISEWITTHTHIHTKMLLLLLLQNTSARDRRQEGIHMQLALLVFPAGSNVTQLSPILQILSPASLGLYRPETEGNFTGSLIRFQFRLLRSIDQKPMISSGTVMNLARF
jgi:hypothetical protein